jgi:cytochrome c oxidase cbb3-type subunit 3
MRGQGDPQVIARGKTLYDVQCKGCHGGDLRGGDLGGPNLLRSQVALSDQNGELIDPILEGSRQNGGMPAMNMQPDDEKAVVAFVHSVIATIGNQGKPPSLGVAPLTIVVGNVAEGKAFFDAKCASCHSVTGDLAGIGAKYEDPKDVQNLWVSGGGGGRRGGGRGAAPAQPNPRTPNVVVTMPGETVEGKLMRIDDFLVTLTLADGTVRSIRRNGDVPKVELRDPMKGHKDLLPLLSDKDMHDVTAYLVTLK